MKSFSEITEVKVTKDDLPSIYCDMDMVLCDFMKSADNVVGGSFVQADKSDRWDKISNTKNFWANLEWMPGAKRLYGFIMKWSGLFPHLQKYYYDKLGVVRSMYHDGISGLIVQFTLLFLVTVKNFIK